MVTQDPVTVDLFFHSVKVASTKTDMAHRFVFEGVLSGEYTVRVSDAVSAGGRDDGQKGCWGAFEDASPFTGAAAEETVVVKGDDVMNVVLHQRGYVMSIHALIDTEAELVSKDGLKQLMLKKGVNRFCVAKKHYRLIPHGCYKCVYDELTITAEHSAVELVPSLYRIEGEIELEGGKGESVGASRVTEL